MLCMFKAKSGKEHIMRRMYMDLGMGAEKEKLCAALFDLLTDEEKAEFIKTVEGLGLEGVCVKASHTEKECPD